MWISSFGAPRGFLCDKKREFVDENYWQMNEKLNIETCTTAVGSQLSNNTGGMSQFDSWWSNENNINRWEMWSRNNSSAGC